jgi:hypothetical protein
MAKGWVMEMSAMAMPPGTARRMSPRASTRVLAPVAEVTLDSEWMVACLIGGSTMVKV